MLAMGGGEEEWCLALLKDEADSAHRVAAMRNCTRGIRQTKAKQKGKE